MTPVIVCIVGTPRSGTSLTARILNLAGVYLGPESEMVRATRWNPSGFWEHRQVAEMNRRLLKALKQDGLTPPLLPPGWEASERFALEREEARTLLSKTFDGHSTWGWKEAGTTLVLPFWQQLLPRMRYVICLRNPIDVVASLGVAGGESDRVFKVWSQHVAAALAHTAGHPRIFVSYDDYLDSRRETIQRLWHFAGNHAPAPKAKTDRLADTIDESLLHHRTPRMQVLSNEDVPLETSSLYMIAELLREVRGTQSDLSYPETAIERAVNVHARLLISAPAADASAIE